MSAEYNFVQWNPTAANQEIDAAYQADPLVTGGAVDGPNPPQNANKFNYQSSTMIAALAYMLKLKGFSPVDGTTPIQDPGTPSASVIALATVLSNIYTTADLSTIVSATLAELVLVQEVDVGWIKLGSVFGNLMLQWGNSSAITSSGATVTTNFPISFAQAPFVILTPELTSTGQYVTAYALLPTSSPLTNFKMSAIFSGGGNVEFEWFAIGLG